MELNQDNVSTQQLGHLGLVAAMIERLGLVEKINRRLPLDMSKGGIVPHGQRVAAMILNGLGFVDSRLYLTPHFFEDKPVSHLLGEGINASHLNDDCLGRGLDEIAAYGTTQLFSEIVFEIAQEQGLLSRRLNLDTTSITLFGEYEVESGKGPVPTYGYSKDNRPDLKQVVLSMVQMGAANIPVWMEALNGNSSDKKSFHDTVRQVTTFMKGLEAAPDNLCFVVDSAFYVSEKLAELNDVTWITRVPSTLKEAQLCLSEPEENIRWQGYNEHYQLARYEKTIAGQTQRWVLVHSQAAHEREQANLYRRAEKKGVELMKALWHLSNKRFSCEQDAIKVMKTWSKKLHYHTVSYCIKAHACYDHKGRPKPDALPSRMEYQIQASLATDLDKLEKLQRALGRFILATNELAQEKLTDSNVLGQYKEQSSIEGGFRFIKNPTFELDSVFLKTPERIGALMMIMTLCLMVYNVAQHQLRR